MVTEPGVILALEKNDEKIESIELFDDEKTLYKFVKKGEFHLKKSIEKGNNDGYDLLSVLKTSPSICTSVESSNSNEIRISLKRNTIKKINVFFFCNLDSSNVS